MKPLLLKGFLALGFIFHSSSSMQRRPNLWNFTPLLRRFDNGSAGWNEAERTVQWEPKRSAIVICDM